MSQCSSSAGLSGRTKTREQQERLFHPSGKGQKMRSGAPNPAAAAQPGLRENAERQWD